MCFFFFSSRRRHTRFKCDWSSDVCSSDLDEVRHKNDMNYNPGQQLIVYLASEGSPVQEERAARSFLEICISAKGPLWAILVLSAHPTSNSWYPSTLAAISNDNGVVGATFEAISEVMASAGLNRIGEEVLSGVVPGRARELDGPPGTVLHVRFCDLCQCPALTVCLWRV